MVSRVSGFEKLSFSVEVVIMIERSIFDNQAFWKLLENPQKTTAARTPITVY